MDQKASDRRDAAAAPMLRSVERDEVVDRVAVEEPLDIRVEGQPVAVTMRTAGDDDLTAAQ